MESIKNNINSFGSGRIIVIVLFILICIWLGYLVYNKQIASSKNLSNEHFDAMGLVYNVPPNWFIKPAYNLNDWIVNVYPEHIQPECLSYSVEGKYGSLEDINYNSQAYRFWRF